MKTRGDESDDGSLSSSADRGLMGQAALSLAPTRKHHQLASRLLEDWPHATAAPVHGADKPVDLLYADNAANLQPDEVFRQLRWGGSLVVVDPRASRIERLARELTRSTAFRIERQQWPGRGLGGRIARMLPFQQHSFVARKTELMWPGDVTGRFSHDVCLTPAPTAAHGYVVTKAVPTHEQVTKQLRLKHPELSEDEVQRRVHKLCDRVFPTFLTREVAILQILRQQLPASYRRRVPTVVQATKNANGFIDRFSMSWLRIGGEPIGHLDFARQAVDMLSMLHDAVGIIHLDLRLDNMVITPHGVGFIDFGSSIKVGETFDKSPMLESLFGEMLRASQVQRQLRSLHSRGRVNALAMSRLDRRMDKGVDCMCLALQLALPPDQPDLAPLIRFDPKSISTTSLRRLAKRYLRPADDDTLPHDSATAMLEQLDKLAAAA